MAQMSVTSERAFIQFYSVLTMMHNTQNHWVSGLVLVRRTDLWDKSLPPFV
jgi:hypothetical protein